MEKVDSVKVRATKGIISLLPGELNHGSTQEVAEYIGRRYDDPAQLEEVRRRLDSEPAEISPAVLRIAAVVRKIATFFQ